MWYDLPEQRLEYINGRQSQLLSQAAAERSAARGTGDAGRRFTGLHLRVGTLLIVIGRTLCEEEVLAPTFR